MSLFPSPFLAKLQDLKLWQGNYEALLQNKSSEINNPSDFDTIEGLSALDSTRSSIEMTENQLDNHQNVDWDKKVVTTPSKPFEQLLEEKLAEDEPVLVPVKPKKPFLRKGAGLTRYRMSYPQPKKEAKKVNKKLNFKKLPTSEKIQTKMSPRHEHCFKANTDNSPRNLIATPLTMPNMGIKPKGIWVKVQRNDTEVIQKDSKSNHAVEVEHKENFMGKMSELALRHLLPHSPKKNGYALKSPAKPYKPQIQELDSKSHLENTERELRVFEDLEERVEHSSFSSTNSSIVRMLSSSSTPNTHKNCLNIIVPIPEENLQPNEQYADDIYGGHYQNNIANKIHEINKKQDVLHHFLSNLKNMVNQKDIEIEHRPQTARLKKFITPDTSFSEQETNTDTRSPTSSSFYTDFESTFKNSVQNKTDVGVNTSFPNKEESIQNSLECQSCAELKHQLSKLMKEVPDIQAEKARVCDFAKDLEKKRDLLNKEMQKIKVKYEKDIEDLQGELETEKKKFVREKAVFDMYIKESQNRPTKKDREELTFLKKELTDTKELLKLKETKNGATQARLRNQIKSLEKEKEELKTSIENLQKENSKLNASRRIQRPSEVKMLHEINKNLTKLTEETFKKQISKSELNSPNLSRESVKKQVKNREDENEENENKSPSKPTKISFKMRKPTEKHSLGNGISVDSIDLTDITLEKQYETTFGQFNSPDRPDGSINESKREKIETIFPDGSKEIKYSNGNSKIMSPDGNLITVRYYNGDVKEINIRKNILKYFYSENCTWHTQFGDGSELLEYASGQKEKKYKDGKKEITCPDGTFVTKSTDGTEEILYPDGSKMVKNIEGEKILHLPNGQKEIHTGDHKRREYPDGTIKILYVDGTQETRYASGRVRIKGANGLLIMDSNDC